MEPGRFVVAQKAGDGDVLLKLLPVCANASCTAEASRSAPITLVVGGIPYGQYTPWLQKCH